MIDTFTALEQLRRWLAWREERRGSARALPTKVPYAAAGTGNYGSSTDPATWGTRSQAEGRKATLAPNNGATGAMTGIGIVLGALGAIAAGRVLIGIDLDSCLDQNGAISPWGARIVNLLGTYAEISPSGSGLKAFAYIDEEYVRPFLDLIGVERDAWGCKRSIPGLERANHGPAIEVYAGARYFTVTEQIWSIDHQQIVELDRATLEQLAQLIPDGDPAAPADSDSTGKPGARPRSSKGKDGSRSAKALSAALTLAPDTYDEMVGGLREHLDPDIKAWVEDKGEAHGERELKRLWDRFVAARALARTNGLDDLAERTGTSQNIEAIDTAIESPDPEPDHLDLDEDDLELRDDPEDDSGDAPLTQEQIEEQRARIEAAMKETLATLNRHFAVVNEAGKCIVIKRTRDPAFYNRSVLERITFDDLARMYLNRRIEVITRKVTQNGIEYTISKRRLAPWWLEHPRRRQFLGGVTFDPANRAPSNFLNLWRGFAVTPRQGDWSLMKDHIKQVICRGVPADNKYVLDWLARLVQHPEEPGEVALVVRSTEKGTGKSLFGRYVVRLFGHHGMHITQAPHLTGRFNAHLQDCCVLFADEAFFAGDKAHEGALKGLITEHTLVIEGKYRNVVTARNRLHVLIASNKDWVIPASVDERRFAVFEALDTHQGDRAYFAAITKQMNNGGLAAMLHELLQRDISGFEVRDVPLTEALQTQKTLSLSSLQRWWLAVLERGFLWKSRHGTPWFTDWHDFYTTELLMRSYSQWCDETRPYDRKTREQLGTFFAPLYPASRRRPAHPMFEIDSIDRHAVGVIANPDGSVTTVPKSLDKIAIVAKPDQHGYCVGELEEARGGYLAQLRDIPSPWAAPAD
jgi:Family of unknown function (DUF5906)